MSGQTPPINLREGSAAVFPSDITADEIIIDEEFRLLLPLLDAGVKAALEASLVEHGVRDALVVWREQGVLVDGHNRYEIATRLGLPFAVAEMAFDSREEVVAWILRTQMARRNMNPFQTSYFRGLLYRTERAIHGGKREKRSVEGASSQNESLNEADTAAQGRTAKRIGDGSGVSENTIYREAAFSEGIDAIKEVSTQAQQKIVNLQTKISRKRLQELARAPKAEVRVVAQAIERGTYQPDVGTKTGGSAADAGSNKVAAPGVTAVLQGEVRRLVAAFDAEVEAASDDLAARAALTDLITALQKALAAA
ncbi:MAG: hypothetical protein FWE51_04920 [Coriobacteriia bacterium]|nr:hypothetical protein [Coriobacteriia bacterium]